MNLYAFKPLFKLNFRLGHCRAQIAFIILPRTSSFVVFGHVLLGGVRNRSCPAEPLGSGRGMKEGAVSG